MSELPFVNVCIPVYYSGPEVPRVLDELLTSIEAQDYPFIKTIVSIQETTQKESWELFKVMATRGIVVSVPVPEDEVNGPAKNTNHAVTLSYEGYIKIMNQDDFLDSENTIREMVEMLEGSEHRWLANTCVHTDSEGIKRERVHTPFWPSEKGLVEGINRIGCPSVSMIHSSIMPECDPNLVLCMDCDMWIQLYHKAGMPVIRNVPDVVIRMWDQQLSNQIDYARALETDKIYMRQKYGYA